MSCLGGPISRHRPSPSTITLSHDMTVARRWAMVMTVLCWNWTRIVSWIALSVSMSTLAVASSITITLALRSSARAMQSSWRWPTLRLDPPSSTACLSWPPVPAMYSFIRTLSSASQIWLSEYSLNGSRLERMLPENSIGSCGMIDSCRRRSSSPMVLTSNPSSSILPSESSQMRKRATASVDLPAPVRPTTPIFSPGPVLNEMPRRAGSRSAL
mmetsp:Transcript_30932/g.62733  ORF Transcript_30932/g.62733 Transcript_30932/m.62733 type:complete len:214 (-) Transcript_30932:48-689(-)